MVPHVASLFTDQDTATFDQFRDWILNHPEATSLSRWLLTEPCSVTLCNEQETPTFYQTLAGVTHCKETKPKCQLGSHNLLFQPNPF